MEGRTQAFGKAAETAKIAGQAVTSFDEIRLGAFAFTNAGDAAIGGALAGGISNAASGGYVLYPSKPNTNMMQQVYRK